MRNWSFVGAALLALLTALPVFAASSQPNPVAAPSMQATIRRVDALLAAEDAAVRDGFPEWIWLADGRLLFRADDRALDLTLVAGDRAEPLRVASGATLPAGSQLDGVSPDTKTLFFRQGDQMLALDRATGGVTTDPARAAAARQERPRLISDQFPTTFGHLVERASPDGKWFATRLGDQLALRAFGSDTVRPLTQDGTPLDRWLDTEESAQGLNILWSDDSRLIAAVRLDSSGVAHEPLLRPLVTPPQVDRVAYPRAGQPIHRFHLAVFDVVTGARAEIQTGDTGNSYVNLLAWLPGKRAFLYQAVDREQKQLQIFRAEADSGSVRRLLVETRATYIDTPMTLSPVLVHPVPDGGFLYLSEKDGWRHIYRYDSNGRLVTRLTQGDWPVDEVLRVDRDWVYFRAARQPYRSWLYRVPLAGGAVQPLMTEANVSRVDFSPDGRRFVAVRSGPTRAPEVELHSANGHLLRRLATARLGAQLPRLEPFVTPSKAGWAMHGVILTPPGFDPKRRYPVVEVIYGGMQVDFLPRDAYATGWWRHGYNARMGRLLAESGYVVVYLNAPGTPGRGRAFQDATYGRWPQGVIDDHAKFLRDAAASRPWMDLSRVGIFGNSWGGYLATRALIDAPDLYRSAVALAAPQDFVDHPTYIEPFMGLPAHNAAGYAAGSNLARVGQIQGSLLIVPELLDVNAGFSPSMKLIDAMIAAGRDVELFTMPDVNHRIDCCGWTRERYLYAKALRFFARTIGDGEQPDPAPAPPDHKVATPAP